MRSHTFHVRTTAREQIVLITDQVNAALRALDAGEGVCLIFTPHTTAAISINEDADPDVLEDLTRAFRAMVPEVDFRHGEGNSDAHFLSTLIGVSKDVPFGDGRLLLGRWQGIYFIELDGPRTRDVIVYLRK
ncbi:MAG TPA: secondary thiamine-phosphate synthase enzyme YjbQ [Thermoanaerobaculia bacterium]|nr:secondary thiamine-phosphate synthase enzyme YjbQ [Thermoanaerobaculia bacterium]